MTEQAAVNQTVNKVFDNQRKQAWAHYELQRQLLIEKYETALKHYVDAVMGKGNSDEEMKMALASWYLTARGYFDDIPDTELTAMDSKLDDPRLITMPDAVRLLKAAAKYNFKLGVTNILKASYPDELNLIAPMVRR